MAQLGWRSPSDLLSVRPSLPLLGRSPRSRNARAVVTGAGSGIGRAFAIELGRRGGHVVCSDLDITSAKETVGQVEAAGGQALAVECDVASLEQVTGLADGADAWFDRPVSLVINNAGIGAGGQPVGETSYADWRRVLDVNLWGVIHGCHVFAPRLRAAGRGGVINVASSAGFAAGPDMAPYNVSKAGVMSLSETMAAEFVGSGIAVTVLCPTFVKTAIVENGAIDPVTQRAAARMMRLTGMSADRVARMTLDAHDRGRLHVVPQVEAQLIWRTKRLAPQQYTLAIGMAGRLGRRFL